MRVVDSSYYRRHHHHQHQHVDSFFINAFDELNDMHRKLFEIPEIDKFLSFSNKKNICIQNQTPHHSNFLYYLITKVCINYHSYNLSINSGNNNKKFKDNRTILIDAGNGNNLGKLYLNLTKLAIEKEIDVNNLLDNIMIVRAFTFYQLANILINELPRFINRLDNKIQIIVLDLFDTLVSSSSMISTKGFEDGDYFRSRKEVEDNIRIVNELIDVLISLSEKYFVILTYNDSKNITYNSSIMSKFDNVIKIKQALNEKEETFEIKVLPHIRDKSIDTIKEKRLVSVNIFRDK